MLQGWLLPLLIETLSIFSPVTVYGQVSWFLLPKAFPYSSEDWAGVPFNVPNNERYARETQFPTEVFSWESHSINKWQRTCP